MESNAWIISGDCDFCNTPNEFKLGSVDYKGGEEKDVVVMNQIKN